MTDLLENLNSMLGRVHRNNNPNPRLHEEPNNSLQEDAHISEAAILSVVTNDQVQLSNWRLPEPRPEGGRGAYFRVQKGPDGLHRYLSVPELRSAFKKSTTFAQLSAAPGGSASSDPGAQVDQSFPNIDLILSLARGGAEVLVQKVAKYT